MIYLIDFNGEPLGLYNRSEYKIGKIGKSAPLAPALGTIFITNPDLEAFAIIPTEHARKDYFVVTIEDVLSGRTSPDAMKNTKHMILVYGWELIALLKKVHPECFEFSFGGGERLYTKCFSMGEPVE